MYSGSIEAAAEVETEDRGVSPGDDIGPGNLPGAKYSSPRAVAASCKRADRLTFDRYCSAVFGKISHKNICVGIQKFVGSWAFKNHQNLFY